MRDSRPDASQGLPWLLLVAIAIYVVLRAAILATAFDDVAIAAYEQYPMGTMPQVLLDGTGVPHRNYYDNAAGQLLVGYLALPYYMLLGPCYLALKLVPATLGLGVLVLAWLFCNAHFGRRSANLAALLVALGPATLVKYSLFASGNHFENLFFSLLALVAFYRLHSGGRRALWLPLAGFTAGLAIFVFLGAILPVGLCVLAHVAIRGARGTLVDLRIGLPAWVLGASPLLALNISTHGRGIAFLSGKFKGGSQAEPYLADLGPRLHEFFFEFLPGAPSSIDLPGIPGSVLDGLLLGSFLVAWCVFVPDGWRAMVLFVRGLFDWRKPMQHSSEEQHARLRAIRGAPLVFLLPLTGLAYGLSDFRIRTGAYGGQWEFAAFRYFNWHLLVSLLLIAAAFGRLVASSSKTLRVVGLALGLVAIFSSASNLAIPDWTRGALDHGRRYEGYNYSHIARALIAKRNLNAHEEIIAEIGEFSPRQQHDVVVGIGFYEALRASGRKKKSAFIPIEQLLAAWPEEYRADIGRGIGRFLRDVPVKGRAAMLLSSLPKSTPQRGAILEGLFEPWSYPLERRTEGALKRNSLLVATLSKKLGPALARGHGRFCGRLIRRAISTDLERVDRALGELKSTDRRAFFFGLGFGVASSGASAELPEALLERLGEAKSRAQALRGFGAGLRHADGPAGLAERIATFSRGLSPVDVRALRSGAQLGD